MPSAGNSLDPRSIGLIDKIMEPASWLTTLVYKPIYAVQALMIAIPWKRKCGIPATHGAIVAFLQALRTSPPPFATANLKIGAAGFCWGGKHTILLAQDPSASRVVRHESQTNAAALGDQVLLDCAFTAHPSYVEVPVDIEAIRIPISVAVGDVDMAMKAPLVQQMKKILDAKNQNGSSSSGGAGDYEVIILPGAKHGFAVRTHPDDKHEMECAEKAEVQALEWFTRWLT
jgi:dienelactone hydrolase